MMYTNVQKINYPSFKPTIEGYYPQQPQPLLTFPVASKGVVYQQNPQIRTGHRMLILQPVRPMWIMYPMLHPTPASKVYDMMSVEQTADWIRAFSAQRGWMEADAYAKTFKEKNIKGSMLKHLNYELLNFDLGISNFNHRLELLSIIRQLFPSVNQQDVISAPAKLSELHKKDVRSDSLRKTTSASAPLRGCPKPQEYKPAALQYLVPAPEEPTVMDLGSVQNTSTKSDSGCSKLSTKSSSTVSMEMSDSQSGTRKSLSVKPTEKPAQCPPKYGVARRKSFLDLYEAEKPRVSTRLDMRTSLTGHSRSNTAKTRLSAKLLLTLPNNKTVQTESIRKHFLKFHFIVSIKRLQREKYVVVFNNRAVAMSALNRQSQMGYKLQPYEATQLPKRPTPKHPVDYRVLSQVTVRSGKSFRGEVVGTIYKGEVVTANKLKGRRVRVTTKRCNSNTETVGWVSLRTEQGMPLLKQINRSN